MPESIEAFKSELPDRYRIMEILGQGGAGVVFKAFDSILDKPVAIKMVTVELSEKNLIRFQSEAKILGKLDHRNILTALDFNISKSNKPYLVLDFLDGVNLEKYIKKNGPFEPEDAMVIIDEIVSALEYAHQNSVIHRDIKPSNVMLHFNEKHELEAKVVDFGLSKLTEDDQSITTTGSIMGSPLYMSPEQARGENIDARSDIYSTGCLIYKMLTGEPPVKGKTSVETIKLKLEEKPLVMRDINPDIDVPEALEAIVEKCLSIDPGQRYSSMAELKDALYKLAEVPAVAETEVDTAKNSGGSYMVAGILVALLFVALAAFLFFEKPEEPGKKIESAPVQVPEKDNEYIDKTIGNAMDSVESYEPDSHFAIKHFPGPESLSFVIARGEPNDEDLKELGATTNIGRLKLENTKITGVGLKYVDYSSPMTLNLASSKVDDDGMKVISGIKTLSKLELRGNKDITTKGFKYLENLENLSILNLQGTKISDDGLRTIAKIKTLNRLDLQNSDAYTARGISYLNGKNLTWLQIGGKGMKPGIFKAIARLKNLDHINIERIEPDSLDRGLKELGDTNISILELTDYIKLPEDLARTLAGMKNLKSLKFSRCAEISPKMLYSLKEALPDLESLEFEKMYFGNRAAIQALKSFTHLKVLRVPRDIAAQLKSVAGLNVTSN